MKCRVWEALWEKHGWGCCQEECIKRVSYETLWKYHCIKNVYSVRLQPIASKINFIWSIEKSHQKRICCVWHCWKICICSFNKIFSILHLHTTGSSHHSMAEAGASVLYFCGRTYHAWYSCAPNFLFVTTLLLHLRTRELICKLNEYWRHGGWQCCEK